jgi:hypothetical protein
MALITTAIDTVLTVNAVVVASSDVLTQATTLKCSVLNTDSSPHAFSLYRVPYSGNIETSYQMFKSLVIGANSTVIVPINGQGLSQGQSFQATADTDNVLNFSITIATNTL